MSIVTSVLEVASPAIWAELEAITPLAEHVEGALSPTHRVVRRSFVRKALPVLRERGVSVLVRFATAPETDEASGVDLGPTLAALPDPARAILHRAQRRANDGTVLGGTVWDPVGEAQWVDALCAAGLLEPLPTEAPPRLGPYRLAPDLPAPPPVAYDFTEAVFDAPDDLEPAAPSPDDLLGAIAALAAGLSDVVVTRTLAGPLAKAPLRRLAKRLALGEAARTGRLQDAGPRWTRAWALAEGVGLFETDTVTRAVTIEPQLDGFLAGEAAARLDRLLARVLEPDMRPLLPPIRAALKAAGTEAIDDVVWLELLAEQHRDILFSPWGQVGRPCYPAGPGEVGIPYDEDRFIQLEGRLAEEVLGVLAKVGLVRRAPGVFAATPDGLAWAGAPPPPRSPVWVTSDLEVVVPPGALSPADRLDLERLARCTSRDVVERYRLDKSTLASWLRAGSLEGALDLLARHTPAVPVTVTETLTSWSRSVERVVLTHGVLLDALPGDKSPMEGQA